MISIKRIIEQYGAEGQYYDLGKDFSNFRRTGDRADEEIKRRFEQSIGSKLVGKRIRANASRGYKQFIKQYEFDVVRITLDNYYDNYVVVAHDNTTPKPKEYFLKPGLQITILGPATGQPSPQKGGKPQVGPQPVQPKQSPTAAQSQPMALAPAGNTPSENPMKEDKATQGYYDAYSINSITDDVKKWLPSVLKKPENSLQDYVAELGWLKQITPEIQVAMFELKIPGREFRSGIKASDIKQMVQQSSKPGSTIDIKFEVVKFEPDKEKGEWHVRIKKTMTGKSV